MNTHTTNRITRRLAPLAFALLWASPSLADVAVDRTVPTVSDAFVEIEVLAGTVEVVGTDRDQVTVTGTIGDEVEELRVESHGNRVEIEVELPRRSRGRVDVDLRIEVPRRASLEVESVSAKVSVERVEGDLEVETVSGGIEITGPAAMAEIETVSGTVRASGPFDELSASSVSGSMRLRDVNGPIVASTVSSGIELSGSFAHRTEAEAVSGKIVLSGTVGAKARIDLSSHSGAVIVSIPRTTSARFDVETFSGGIDNELGPRAERTSRYGPGRTLRFSLGDGEASVRLHSFSGGVTLREP